MDRPDRGIAIATAGLALLAVTLLGSALLAPQLGGAQEPGNRTLVGIHGDGVGWHEGGEVYLLNGSARVWTEASADSYFDVETLGNGSLVAGFMDGGYEDCGPYNASGCAHTGFRLIEPGPDARVTGEYGVPVRTEKNSEVHAATPLPAGGFLVGDMEHERVYTWEHGEITWQWNASSFYDPPADPTRTDWLHLNDVDHVGDDRYMVSIRNANQILVLERGAGVVEVINADRTDADDANCRGRGRLADTDGDGDIRCGDPAVLNSQHNPQWLGEGAVLVADSHNDRVVELHRNATGVWEPVWSLERAGGVPFDWPRDADRLPNNHTLVTDTLNKRVVEVNATGSVVWSHATGAIPYEADRLPAGEPVGAPTLGATSSPGGGTGDHTARGGDVPLLSTALLGLQAVFPGLPFWFKELQLGLTALSLLLVAAGAGLRYRR